MCQHGIYCHLMWIHHVQWIYSGTILHYFKVQMISRTITCTADITNHLSCRYRFTCGNGSLRHMGIPRRQARTAYGNIYSTDKNLLRTYASMVE